MRHAAIIPTWLIISVSVVHAGESKVELCGYEWPPYQGSKLENYGYTVEILYTAFELMGYTCRYEVYPWERSKMMLEKGLCDVLVNMHYTEKRALNYGFPANPLGHSSYALIALKTRDDIPERINAAQLEKLTVGLLKDAGYGEEFDKIKSRLPNVIHGIIERSLLGHLIKKRVDIAPFDENYVRYLIDANTDMSPADFKIVNSTLFKRNLLYPMFSKKGHGYKKKISDYDRAMNRMKEDGTLKRIYQKHGIPFTHGEAGQSTGPAELTVIK